MVGERMLKIITFLITKAEWRLSKQDKKRFERRNPSEKLMLYRDLLNFIDRYNEKTTGITTFRHYRYFNFSTFDVLAKNIKNEK
jgi:hypothetical protein